MLDAVRPPADRSTRPLGLVPTAALLVVVVALAAGLLFAASPRFSAGSADLSQGVKTTIIAQTGSELLALDPRSGQVLTQRPGAAAVIAVSADTRTVLAQIGEAIHVYRLPDWEERFRIPLTTEIPPVAALARQFPDFGAEPPRLFQAAVAPDGRFAVLGFISYGTKPDARFFDTLPWVIWVAGLDLKTGRWSDWAFPVPGAQNLTLLATSESLLVLSHDNQLSPGGHIGTVYHLDPASGALRARATLVPEIPGTALIAGTEAARAPGMAGARISDARLVVVTEQLEVFVLDPVTLRLVEHHRPLSENILAREALILPNHVVALTHTDELLVVDRNRHAVVARQPVEADELVAFDPEDNAALVMTWQDRGACLERIESSGDRHTLRCGLDTNPYEPRYAVGGLP
jgi:hypothetical protein